MQIMRIWCHIRCPWTRLNLRALQCMTICGWSYSGLPYHRPSWSITAPNSAKYDTICHLCHLRRLCRERHKIKRRRLVLVSFQTIQFTFSDAVNDICDFWFYVNTGQYNQTDIDPRIIMNKKNTPRSGFAFFFVNCTLKGSCIYKTQKIIRATHSLYLGAILQVCVPILVKKKHPGAKSLMARYVPALRIYKHLS